MTLTWKEPPKKQQITAKKGSVAAPAKKSKSGSRSSDSSSDDSDEDEVSMFILVHI